MKNLIILFTVTFLFSFNTFSFAIFDENGKFEEGWESVWIGSDEIPYPNWSLFAPSSYEDRNGEYNQTTTDAKNPLSTGNRGLRTWYNDSSGEPGPASSGPALIAIPFDSPQTELWFRFYIRYQDGFRWWQGGNPFYDKQWRLYAHGHGGYPNAWIDATYSRIRTEYGRQTAINGPPLWGTVFSDANNLANGEFVAVEVYLKMETARHADDGVARFWVNGTLMGESTNVGFVNFDQTGESVGESALNGWVHLILGNQDYVQNSLGPIGRDVAYVDFDDIVIYNKTPPNVDASGNPFIGPIGWNGEPTTLDPEPQPVNDPTSPTENGAPAKGELLISETFVDNNWTSRGWYDGTNSTGVVSGGYSGNALRWNWASSAQRPEGFSIVRRQFPASDEFLIEYYVKYEDGWQGSGLNWHPHLIHILSTDDDVYQGLSRANSGLYFESLANNSYPYTNYPQFAHQDFQRVNTGYGTPVVNLTDVTEMRSANQCNTPYQLSDASFGTCYNDGSGWYSANTWRSDNVSIPANQWVKITGYVKKNTVTAGVGNFDGIVRLWVDDQLAIESTGVHYATGAYADTKWDKIMLAPWIGDGSPVNQTMWLDELKIWSVLDSGGSSVVEPPPMLQLNQ